MPNYQNGKIYCIRSPNTEQIYIGSTVDTLCRRFSKHKNSKTNQTQSKILFDAGDAYIELIELYPCNSKEELNKREGEIMRATLNCCNRYIAGRTNAEYYKDNIDKRKEYLEANKDSINEKKREYMKKYRAKV